MLIAGIVICAFWVYRHHKMAYPPVLVPTQVSYCPIYSLLRILYFKEVLTEVYITQYHVSQLFPFELILECLLLW